MGIVEMPGFHYIEGTKAASQLGRRGGESRARLLKAGRPQRVDPTTSDIIYSDDEVEFMNAVRVYQQKTGRKFPTYSELLKILKGLGYQKVA